MGGSAYTSLVRSNQRLRAANLQRRLQDIEEAPATEYTPRRQVNPSQTRLHWQDTGMVVVLGSLTSLEQGLVQANSTMLHHLAQSEPQSQQRLTTSLQRLDLQLEDLQKRWSRIVSSSSSTISKEAEEAARRMDAASSTLAALRRLVSSREEVAQRPPSFQASHGRLPPAPPPPAPPAPAPPTPLEGPPHTQPNTTEQFRPPTADPGSLCGPGLGPHQEGGTAHILWQG